MKAQQYLNRQALPCAGLQLQTQPAAQEPAVLARSWREAEDSTYSKAAPELSRAPHAVARAHVKPLCATGTSLICGTHCHRKLMQQQQSYLHL